jgi:hypothetical protein
MQEVPPVGDLAGLPLVLDALEIQKVSMSPLVTTGIYR